MELASFVGYVGLGCMDYIFIFFEKNSDRLHLIKSIFFVNVGPVFRTCAYLSPILQERVLAHLICKVFEPKIHSDVLYKSIFN